VNQKPSQRVTILSTGEELIVGTKADTNAPFLARQLTSYGFVVQRMVVVGDEAAAVARELERNAADSDIIVMTGGLGPTADDRTRQAMASVAGRNLVLHEDSLAHLRRIIEAHGRQVTEAHARQAYFPEGSEIFDNTRGTARGFACPLGKATLVAMPGVPDEMLEMFRAQVLPWMLRRTSGTILVRKVNLFGVPESTVDEQLTDMTDESRNPLVGMTVDGGQVSVGLRAWAPTREDALRLLDEDERTVRERFGEAVFGNDETTLAQAVSDLLEEMNWRIALAESCTGGMVGSLLVDVPGISRFLLLDVVAYSNESKVSLLRVPQGQIESFGAVSPEVAEAMARGACKVSGAQIGISTTGIAGPTGGSSEKPVGLVYVGLCVAGKTMCHRLQLRGDRWRIKDRAARSALNLARVALLEARARMRGVKP